MALDEYEIEHDEGADLFKVDSHQNQQILCGAFGVFLEEFGVLERSLDIVYGARTDNLCGCVCSAR